LQANGINDMPDNFYYFGMFEGDMLITFYGDKPRKSNEILENEAEKAVQPVVV
jgi:hypothetical protein